jgi:Uncharacterized conserved protein (COG2071)
MLSSGGMKIPTMVGTIDRRLLLNYRIEPDVVARLLPPPFRPQHVNGFALGGICLIWLKGVRPQGLPAMAGLTSEGAAHRFAVEWDDAEGRHCGVYIPRRDSSSWINVAVGGRLFPGVHHRAHFAVDESAGAYHVEVKSDDGEIYVQVAAREAPALPGDSVFGALEDARRFFEEGCVACSDTDRQGEFDALELRCSAFRVSPLDVEQVASSFFDNRRLFPVGSVTFDSAFLMSGIEHEWHGRGRIRDEQTRRQTCSGRDLEHRRMGGDRARLSALGLS